MAQQHLLRRLLLRRPNPLPHWNSTFHRAKSSITNTASSSSSSPSSLYSDEFWHSPNILDVSPLAESIHERVRQYTSSILNSKEERRLKLVGILGPYHGEDCELYSERIQESCVTDGIDYELWRCTSIQDIHNQIDNANRSSDIDGVLVFYPIYPSTTNNSNNSNKGSLLSSSCNNNNRILPGVYYKNEDDRFRNLVNPRKDVEGLCSTTNWFHHRGALEKHSQMVYPCTAVSVKTILDHYHIHRGGSWKNQTVSIINRSEIVGRPLAVMLAELGATVYSIDVNSIVKFHPYNHRRSLHRSSRGEKLLNIEDCLQESNIVVTGVPNPDFQLPLQYLQSETTLVNVSEYLNVSEQDILQCTDIRYVPFVGKVTVATLQQNLIKLHQAKKNQSRSVATIDDSHELIL